MKQKTMIDFFKGMTAPVMLALLVYFEQCQQPCRSIGKIKRYFSYTQNT
jgi:hypothetical protein